ncbi:hypothetical protein CLAIMM_13602 [Cladophialophora immunda]|nr:hypothetical protein CLAIMM_13602 [Cladophialophora immunda]
MREHPTDQLSVACRDHAVPRCANCANSKTPRTCIYGGLKLRHSKYSKARSGRTQSPGHTTLHPILVSFKTNVQPANGSESWPAEGFIEAIQSAQGPGTVVDSSSNQAPAPDPYGTPTAGTVDNSPSTFFRHELPPGDHVQLTVDPSSETQGVNASDTECSLFQFYKSYAGVWLDIVTAERHLSQTVPRQAVTSPVLYYACLSYASNIMNANEELDETVKEQYHSKVIHILIDSLSLSPNPAYDSNLLATVVILRMSEQFCEIDKDVRHHLAGASSLFTLRGTMHRWSVHDTDLAGTSFWIYLRESLRLCFLNEEICQFDLDLIEKESAFLATSEEAWTNRITYILALVCNFAFGKQTTAQTVPDAAELRKSIDLWASKVPASFRPWSFREGKTAPFPTIHFLSTWHEVAWQHYYTAKIMLAVQGLQVHESTSILELNRYTEHQILGPTRKLCGICLATKEVGSQINGSHLVSWCGQFFTGKQEQRQLVDWLERTMLASKWPNRTCIERLQQIWSGVRLKWADAPI